MLELHWFELVLDSQFMRFIDGEIKNETNPI